MHSDFEKQALVSTATWSRQLKIQPIQVNVPGASRASFKCMRTSSDRTFPSRVAQLSPFNRDLPGPLAKDWIFQTVDHYEKVLFSFCQHQQFFSLFSVELFSIVPLPPCLFSRENSLIYPIC